jgi:hypothetical protein
VRFPNRGRGGKNPGHGGSAADVRSRGRLGGVAVPLLALLAGSVTSATVGSRALWSVDREATVETFPPSTGRGPGCSNGRSTAGERGSVRRYDYGSRAYGNGIGYSSCTLADFCPPGVQSNARKNFEFEILKNSTWSCQGIIQGFQKYFCWVERWCFAKWLNAI